MKFFSGQYAKFWNALLGGAGVGAGGVLVLALFSLTGAFPGPEPLELRDAVLGLWVALVSALGAALAANSTDEKGDDE